MENIKDSKIILPEGIGMPYVAIFDGSNAPIIDPVSKLNIGELMEHFIYAYDEEDDDEGELYLRSNNTDLPAHPKLKYHMPIHMQWGWVLSNGSTITGPLRKAIIVSKEATFGSEGLELTIKFSSASVLAKNTPSNYNGQADGFELYVDSLMRGIPVGVEIIDYSDPDNPQDTLVVAEKVIENDQLKDGNSGNEKEGQGYYGSGEYNKDGLPVYYSFPQTPTYKLPDVVGVRLMEYTPERAELAKQFPDKYKVLAYRPERSRNILLTGTRRNRMQQIKDLVNNMPKGPWYVDGRDNKLVIHNKKINRPYSKAYTYAGGNGELIIFSISSDFVKEGVDAGRNIEIDADTGDLTISSVQVAHNEDSPADAYIAWGNNRRQLGEDVTEKYARPILTKEEYLNSPDGKAYQNSFDKPNVSVDSTGQIVVTPNKPDIPVANINQEELQQELQNAMDIRGAYQIPKGDPVFNASKVYDSIEEAISDIKQSFPLQEDEYRDYIEILKKKMDALLMDDPNEENLENAFRGVNKLPDYIMKRRVWVKFTNAMGFPSGKSKQGGPNDPNGIGGEWGFSYLQLVNYIENGTVKNVETLEPDVNNYANRVKSYESLVTLEIPVAGIRILGGFNPNNADVSMGNDIKTSVEQKEKARATVIGDPSLESSQNILIKNVSSLFSGGWYTKKVEHKMSIDGGYLCNIEFVPRVQPYVTITNKASVSTRNILGKIYKKANAYIKSGEYQNRVIWENKIKEVVATNLDYSYLFQIDENNPSQGNVYPSKKAFSYNQVEDPATGMPSGAKIVKVLGKDGSIKK